MRIMSLIAIALFGLCGCNDMRSSSTTTDTPAPDNTAVNERDQDGATKTPTDQGENEADVTRTADIRKRITGTEGLSVSARNVKIITEDGKVTLRGPVVSEKEKETIDQIAKEVAGEENVDNQLEIAP